MQAMDWFNEDKIHNFPQKMFQPVQERYKIQKLKIYLKAADPYTEWLLWGLMENLGNN